jgi:hypothetical protein
MTDAERRLLDAVSLDVPWDLVEAFSTQPRWRPEDVNIGANMITQRLDQLGVPVEVHHPELYLSIPLSASVEAGGQTHRAKPPSSSASVPDGLTAKLAYIPANLKALRSYSRDISELFGGAIASVEEVKARVAGRLFITEGFGNPALTSLVEEWGGAGVIAVNPGEDIHWGTCTTVWGNPDLDDLPRKPRIPVVAVNKPTGEALIAIAKAGGQATLRTEMLEGWFCQKVPVVTIAGSGPDAADFVLVHGHYDSWDVGVGDNATGDATLLELARVLHAHRDALNRSVKIAWWPGHSTGRYAGSTWFADAFALALDEHCVAQINCDSPGCRWATSFHQTRAFAECAQLATGAIRAVHPTAEVATMRPPQAGDYSFNNIGLPSLFMLSSTMPDALRAEKNYYDVSGCGANIAWHTENDTIEIADRDILLADMRIYLLAVARIANAPVLPFDYGAVAAEFRATVARYAAAVGDAADLSPAAAAVDAFSEAWVAFGASTRPPAQKNAALKAVARQLVPINFTRGPRFAHDPAYNIPPLPTLAIAAELDRHAGDARGFALTQLLRGQNRFVAAMRAATAALMRTA